MKNLFVALALTIFVGAGSFNMASAFVSTPAAIVGGEECAKGKKCKKTDSCCKTKTTANNESKCNKGGAKQCCSKTTAVKPAATTSQVKPEPKPVEPAK